MPIKLLVEIGSNHIIKFEGICNRSKGKSCPKVRKIFFVAGGRVFDELSKLCLDLLPQFWILLEEV